MTAFRTMWSLYAAAMLFLLAGTALPDHRW